MKLLLIDGNNLFWRSYHGLSRQNLHYNGIPTWATFGLVNSIINIIKDQEPTHIALLFDSGGSDYRRELFPGYKANRGASTGFENAPDQLVAARHILNKLGVFQYDEFGIEADDLLATFAEKWEFPEVVICSGDKDIRQLIRNNVTILQPSLGKAKQEKSWDYDQILDHYGVEPNRLPEIWALSGDAVDNIPGAKGIGEITAIKLIKKYGSLTNLLLSAEPKIVGELSSIHLSYKLVQANPYLSDCNTSLDELIWEPVHPQTPEGNEFAELLRGFGFTALLSRWQSETLWNDFGVNFSDLYRKSHP